MALSGVILFVFIVLHMLGNLKVLTGAESFDRYAAFLREAGYPAVPHGGTLWAFRSVLLLAVAVRPVGTRRPSRGTRGRGSRMRW